MNNDSLVSAGEVCRRFGIPRSTLYRLANSGRIPVREQPGQPWRSRRHLLFSLAEVAAALGVDRPPA